MARMLPRRPHADPTLLVPLLLGIVVLVDLAVARGVLLSPDSTRYLQGAQALIDGRGLSREQLPYAGYIGLVAGLQRLGLGIDGIIAFQYACVLVAIAAVWSAAGRIAGRRAALLAALLVALSPDLTRFIGWPTFLLTDVPYMSSVAVVMALTLRAAAGGRADLGWLLVASSGVVLLRPTGWLLVATCWSWLAYVRRPAPIGRLSAAVPWLVCLAIPIATGIAGGDTFARPVDQLQQGTVVFDSTMWRPTMPKEPGLGAGYGGALQYALRHPIATADLMARRIAAEALHVRTVNSAAHNLVAGGYSVVLLLGAAIALVKFWRRPEPWLAAVLVALHLLVVGIHWADYDGRFFVQIVPALAVLAGVGWTSWSLPSRLSRGPSPGGLDRALPGHQRRERPDVGRGRALAPVENDHP